VTLASANIEGGSEIFLRGEPHHSVVRDALRPQHILVERRQTQLGERYQFIGEDQSSCRLVLHTDRPRIDHAPFLVSAIALLVEAAVEIKINSLRSHGLTEQNTALAARQIGYRRERATPEAVLGRSVVDQVENLFDLFVREVHCNSVTQSRSSLVKNFLVQDGIKKVAYPSCWCLTQQGELS